MLIAGYFAKRSLQRVSDARCCRGVVFAVNADGAFTCHSVTVAAKCYFYWYSGRQMLYFQDLMPGQAVQPPRSIPTLRAWGWIIAGSVAARRRDLEYSRCVLVCDGDDYRHSVLLTAIADV